MGYGIQLTDNIPGFPNGNLGDDLLDVVVRRDADGNVYVQLRSVDVVADVLTVLQSNLLTPEAGQDQIVLRLSHEASNPGVIRSSS